MESLWYNCDNQEIQRKCTFSSRIQQLQVDIKNGIKCMEELLKLLDPDHSMPVQNVVSGLTTRLEDCVYGKAKMGGFSTRLQTIQEVFSVEA